MSQLGEETVVQHFDGLMQVVQYCGGVEQGSRGFWCSALGRLGASDFALSQIPIKE